MVPSTPTELRSPDLIIDLDIARRDRGLRDHDDRPLVATGVIDLSGRLRPTGSRRSSRHTHTRLIAALARIHADDEGRVDAAAALARSRPEHR